MKMGDIVTAMEAKRTSIATAEKTIADSTVDLDKLLARYNRLRSRRRPDNTPFESEEELAEMEKNG